MWEIKQSQMFVLYISCSGDPKEGQNNHLVFKLYIVSSKDLWYPRYFNLYTIVLPICHNKLSQNHNRNLHNTMVCFSLLLELLVLKESTNDHIRESPVNWCHLLGVVELSYTSLTSLLSTGVSCTSCNHGFVREHMSTKGYTVYRESQAQCTGDYLIWESKQQSLSVIKDSLICNCPWNFKELILMLR